MAKNEQEQEDDLIGGELDEDMSELADFAESEEEKDEDEKEEKKQPKVEIIPTVEIITENKEAINFSVKADKWKRYVKAISAMVSEGTLNFVKEGVYVRATNPEGTALVDLKVPKSELNNYAYEKDTPTSISIDFKRYEEQTKRMSDTVSVMVEPHRIVSKVVDGDTNREFILKTLADTANTPTKMPTMEWIDVVAFDKSFITKAIGDIDLFGDSNSNITFTTLVDKSSINGRRLLMIGEDEMGKVVISKKEELKEDLNTCFRVNLLKASLKALDDKEKFKTYLKTGKPLKVEYDIGSARVAYLIAPLITE